MRLQGAEVEAVVRAVVSWCRRHSHPEPSASPFGMRPEVASRLSALGRVAAAAAPALFTGALPVHVGRWLEPRGPAPSPDLVDGVRRAVHGGADVFGACYARLTSRAQRRYLGTFFTPAPVVRHMLDLAFDLLPDPAHVVDPGAGVGAFTAQGLGRWPRAKVHAVDVNAVTLGALAVQQSLAPSGPEPERLRLHHDDYLRWIDDDRRALRGATLTVGNPPYTRYHQLSAETRALAAEAPGRGLLTGAPGLAAIVLAATLERMGPDDAACLLLPANWLDARYADGLRRALWSANRDVQLELFPPAESFFDDAAVAACVLSVGPRATRRRFVTRQVHRSDRFDITPGPDVEHDTGEPAPAGFSTMMSRTGLPAAGGAAVGEARQAVPLAALARTRRGVATGANRLFFLMEDERAGLPPGALRRALLRVGHVQGDALDEAEHRRLRAAGRPCWLVDCPQDLDDDPGVLEWRAGLQRAGVHARALNRGRGVRWWSVEPVGPPDLILAPMSKGDLRLVVNPAGVVISNSSNGLYLLHDPPPGAGPAAGAVYAATTCAERLARLVAWLRSDEGQALLRQHARLHARDLAKLELRALARVPVPLAVLTGGR